MKENPVLTVNDAIHGSYKCLMNAGNLINEAELLIKNHMYARAFYLLIISVEETGKYFLLFSNLMNIATESIDWKNFWNCFNNHKIKIEHFLNYSFLPEPLFVQATELFPL